MIAIGPYVAGEIPPPLVYQFLDSAGVAINLTGFTRASFNFQRRGAAAVVRTISVTSPTTGQVTRVWSQADLATPGSYSAHFVVDNGSNLYQSDRIVYLVSSAVGTVPAI